MDGEEVTKIPFGAFDSELKGWEYTIPEGMEAVIKDGKIIVREKESKDERIIKWLISTLKSLNSTNVQIDGAYEMMLPAIAWLEKQGSQNLANSEKTCKVEPKFKVGDWVVTKDGKVNQVKTVSDDGDAYTLDDGTYFSGSWKDMYHLWTIEDAKDGDVLYTPKGCGVEGIFLIGGWKQVEDTGRTLCSDIGYRVEDDEIIAGGLGAIWWKGVVDPFYPATKEQRDLLFQKMKEAGYEWDAEKKELVKVEQNPAWSGEDIIHLNKCISYMSRLDSNEMDWLKSLKERYAWKPSEEQLKKLKG